MSAVPIPVHFLHLIFNLLGRRRALEKAEKAQKTPGKSESPEQSTALVVRSPPEDEAKSLSQNQPDLYLDLMSPKSAMSNVLGQGRIDPFNVHSVQDASSYVHETLDHGTLTGPILPSSNDDTLLFDCLLYTIDLFSVFSLSNEQSSSDVSLPLAMIHTWPGVAPAPPNIPNPVKRAWLHCALNSPMAFYSFIFAAGFHQSFLRQDTDPQSRSSLIGLSYKTQAISLINEHLSELSETPSDALIVSILVLAAHGTKIDPDRSLGLTHPISPLARTQNLDFYASLEFGDAHMKALTHLILQKGGLDTIQLWGLADTIAL